MSFQNTKYAILIINLIFSDIEMTKQPTIPPPSYEEVTGQ